MKKRLIILISMLIIITLSGCDLLNNSPNKTNSGNESSQSIQSSTAYNVDRVVDGDTIVVDINGSLTKVRLIGVNTPESVSPDSSKNCEEGKIASDYTKNILEGSFVYLEYDVDQYDKYDRTLAYVYLPNGQMLNKILIEMGYAEVMTIEPNVKYKDEFESAQREAKKSNKGFWAVENCF